MALNSTLAQILEAKISGQRVTVDVVLTILFYGYEDMPIEKIKNFRQPGAKTAGHPECG